MTVTVQGPVYQRRQKPQQVYAAKSVLSHDNVKMAIKLGSLAIKLGNRQTW